MVFWMFQKPFSCIYLGLVNKFVAKLEEIDWIFLFLALHNDIASIQAGVYFVYIIFFNQGTRKLIFPIHNSTPIFDDHYTLYYLLCCSNVKKSNRFNIQWVFSSCTKHKLYERLGLWKNVKARLKLTAFQNYKSETGRKVASSTADRSPSPILSGYANAPDAGPRGTLPGPCRMRTAQLPTPIIPLLLRK